MFTVSSVSYRLLRSDVDRAIHIGYIMLKITSTIHAVQITLRAIPLMVYALLIRRQISEAVTLILELSYYSKEDTDNSGKTWFFSTCIVFLLETGYTIATYHKCEKFYQIEGDTLINIRDSEAERRFYIVMWLWCVRNEEFESAHVWNGKISKTHKNPQSDDSLNDLITNLYLLEGLLLFMVAKINKRNYEVIANTKHQVHSLIRILGNASNVSKIIIPRFHHLKAYFQLIEMSYLPTSNVLIKSKDSAEKHGNLLELAWIEHSDRAWNNELSQVQLDFWKEHCDDDNILDYHEIDLNNGRLGLFSLPIPKYF
ncbi:hypothetical protein FQR65_LT09057 [Abscondita terminalis]|nr:hypothetical protein FQR65_LT09057 [Abscondita terminalis]